MTACTRDLTIRINALVSARPSSRLPQSPHPKVLSNQVAGSPAARGLSGGVRFLDPLRLHYGGYRTIEGQVEALLKSRTRRKKLSYLVKWYGHPQPSWEPCGNLTNCDELLARFHYEHPRARGWRWAAKRLSPSMSYGWKVFEEHVRLSELENEQRSLTGAYNDSTATRAPAAVDTASVSQCSSPPHEPTTPQWFRVGNTDGQSASAPAKNESVDGTHGQANRLDMRGVGLPCISPGFSTQDAWRREQLQRSMEVQQRQREMIASRSASLSQRCEFREDADLQSLLGRHGADPKAATSHHRSQRRVQTPHR